MAPMTLLLLAYAAGVAAYGSATAAKRIVPKGSFSTAHSSLPKATATLEHPGSEVQQHSDFDLWPKMNHNQPKGPSEYALNKGRAIDALRHDYPLLLTEKPDLSIFTDGVELHDGSGKRIRGRNHYERIFDVLRFVRKATMQASEVSYRLIASEDDIIRVRWSAKMWMKEPSFGGGPAAPVHLDGVSLYELDDKGMIRVHRLEDIAMIQDHHLQPVVNLAFAWPRAGLATPEVAMPFFRLLHSGVESFDSQRGEHGAEQGVVSRRGPDPVACASGDETPMQKAAREREEMANEKARLSELRTPKKPKGGAFSFGLRAPQPCETSYDCESPLVCCDLIFTSVCCGGGMMIPVADPTLQRQAIPIPVDRDSPYPPGYPGPGGVPPGLDIQ